MQRVFPWAKLGFYVHVHPDIPEKSARLKFLGKEIIGLVLMVEYSRRPLTGHVTVLSDMTAGIVRLVSNCRFCAL